ncbi:MAG: lipoyl(octanoyl) transferase LipB [Gemmatimonadota bacterium]|jgi:lipoyl(octanoyl) transferase
MPEGGRRLEVRLLGTLPYGEGLSLQQELVRRRRAGEIPDQLLLLEHPHVITFGASAKEEHLLLTASEMEARGIHRFDAGRGGDITYHGPGQLVGYPVLDLKPDRRDLHRYLRDLEEALILALRSFGISGGREEGLTGVWVPQGKLAAIGVRVSSGWITSHGFALNVDPDLSFFSSIVPCGIRDRPVTSLGRLLERPVPVAEVIPAVIRGFEDTFDHIASVA